MSIRTLFDKNSIIFTSTQRKKKADMRKRKVFRTNCYVVVNLLGKRRLKNRSYILVQRRRRTSKKLVYVVAEKRRYITIAVMMAKRFHLFPFRTQKLSSFTPKVLAGYCWEDR